jgi:hypothetical protein
MNALIFLMLFNFLTPSQKHTVQFIFCSDLHYGLSKKFFRNDSNVSAAVVNAAMVESMKTLPNTKLPIDGGVGSGEKVGSIEGVIITGDISNRQETEVQSATQSWNQFEEGYLNNLHLLNASGENAPFMLTPGNHDISNAIGFTRPMNPLTDKAAMVGIYNLDMKAGTAKTRNDFSFQNDKIHYSINTGGIHFMFVSAWPDSAERIWMQQDLKLIPSSMPAFIFTHSDPNPEARFFQNPNGDHSVNTTDKFENLVEERFKDGLTVKSNSTIEQRGLVTFLQAHPNIKAYFHGHTNYAEFYDWNGPDSSISLPCFRVDSPLKGRLSSKDETKASFNLISIDPETKKMTVRECLWNVHPTDRTNKVEWGIERTIFY